MHRIAQAATLAGSVSLALPAAWAAGTRPASLHATHADAAPAAAAGQIDLSDIAAGVGGFVINGRSAGEHSGGVVTTAGDVNGDGLVDIAIAVPAPSYGGRLAGHTYIVFGRTDASPVELSAVTAGVGGFIIRGECTNDASGNGIAAAGDLNGDGLADLVVGAPGHDGPAGADAGRTYVVFGRTATTPVDLSAIAAGAGGFVIEGANAGDRSGTRVAAGGDINGDGFDDLLVGVGPDADIYVYVVFGRGGTAPVALSAVASGDGGFVIHGATYENLSVSAGAGDVNGDGLADVVIGDGGRTDSPGQAWVVFGKSNTARVELTDISAGSGGFVMHDAHAYDVAGTGVAAAGDFNGDGLADLVVGAPNNYYHGRTNGDTYIVFGKTDTAPIELSAIDHGVGGVVIVGTDEYGFIGNTVWGAGDVNGDGLADVLIGESPNIDFYAGRAWVVYGRTAPGTIALASVEMGQGGFVINGECSYDGAGTALAAGDLNGDGLADLIVGAPLADAAAGKDAGKTYVVFGATTGAFAPTFVDKLGGPGDNKLTGSSASETLVGGAGADRLTGRGGADVLYGGSGDDTFVLNASNIQSLVRPFGAGHNTQQLARVDGGTGFDMISLAGAGLTFDLTHLARPGGALPGNYSRIESIERIDLTGSGDNTLRVDVASVQDMASRNVIHGGTNPTPGWTSGTYHLPANVSRYQLVVDGDSGDVVSVTAGAWKNVGTVLHDGQPYVVYRSASGQAQLIVNQGVAVQSGAAMGQFAGGKEPD